MTPGILANDDLVSVRRAAARDIVDAILGGRMDRASDPMVFIDDALVMMVNALVPMHAEWLLERMADVSLAESARKEIAGCLRSPWREQAWERIRATTAADTSSAPRRSATRTRQR